MLLLLIGLPPVTSANDALLQLRTGKVDAIANVEKACRGKLRHELPANPKVTAELDRLSRSTDLAVAKAALDAHRCLPAPAFVAILTHRLDAIPAVAAYAAEVSARVGDPSVVPPLLDALEANVAACNGKAESVDLCVWLTYAPGASLGGAPETVRRRAAGLAAKLLDSPHAKVREVAVETLASAKVAEQAKAIEALIAKEKKKELPNPNTPELIQRFEDRRRALLKGS